MAWDSILWRENNSLCVELPMEQREQIDRISRWFLVCGKFHSKINYLDGMGQHHGTALSLSHTLLGMVARRSETIPGKAA